MDKLKIALVQFSPEWEEPANNILNLNKLLENELPKVDAVIFPEMTLTGFTMESGKFAEEMDGSGTQFFMNVSRKYKNHFFAGIIEKDDEDLYNSLVHFDNGLINARYRKIHPFSFVNEQEHYSSSKETVITHINKVKIGLSICYDLRFPELYRAYGKERCEIIINIANWPVTRIDHWKTLLKARAIENQCYIIGVNRVGKDNMAEFNGASAVFDPMGKEVIICTDEEKIFTIEIDLEKTRETRKKFPFLNDITLI
ncbi:MAG: hypothetical protein JEY94_00325 [Melioribacteraceae bacterium]|nr:hypothetical protein [Melioribacteraceae bacterium]